MALDESTVAEITSAVEALPTENQNSEEKNNSEERNSNSTDGNVAESTSEGDENIVDGGEPSAIQGTEDGNTGGSEKDREEVVKPQISDFALTQAIQAGFTIEEARAFGSDKLLHSAIDKVIRAQEKQTKTETPIQEEQQEDILALLPELDPEQYEPEVIKAFDAVKDVIKKQQEVIQGLVANSKQESISRQQAAMNELESWFDKQVCSLGEDFEDVLGKGNYSSLDRSSPQRAKRDEIANQAAILIAGYQKTGQQPPPREEVFHAAAKLVLGEEFQKVKEKKISAELEKRSKQHIQRAGGNKQKTNGNPLEETAALLDQKFFSK